MWSLCPPGSAPFLACHTLLCPTVVRGVTVRVANPAGPGVTWFQPQAAVAFRAGLLLLSQCMRDSFELQEQPQQ